MNASQPQSPPTAEQVPKAKKRKVVKVLLVAAGVFALLLAALYGSYRIKYPYGASHCCILIMEQSLQSYADDHNGQFPAGEATPEASLSLLYRGNYADAYLLRGMTVSAGKAAKILKGGGLLGPDSCGWHYVAGLKVTDDPRIAILWNKAGLGHNGERRKDGGREVLLVGGSREFVTGKNWDLFLKGQQDLLEQNQQRKTKGAPVLTGYSEEALYKGPFGLYAKLLPSSLKSPPPSGTASRRELQSFALLRQGPVLLPSHLTWYRSDVPTNGMVEYILVVGDYSSYSIVVNFTNSMPDKTVIPFQFSNLKMKPE